MDEKIASQKIHVDSVMELFLISMCPYLHVRKKIYINNFDRDFIVLHVYNMQLYIQRLLTARN